MAVFHVSYWAAAMQWAGFSSFAGRIPAAAQRVFGLPLLLSSAHACMHGYTTHQIRPICCP
jgi:hypothetical protein